MKSRKFKPDDYEVPLRYAVQAGDWLVLSGHVGHREFTLVEGGFEAQCRQTIENIISTLNDHGADSTHVVKGNVYLASIDDFMLMNDIWTEYFHAPFPARTAMEVTLPFGALVEMEVWAYTGSD
jgi:2-iminobutanoate/2-iminopropanoate deaminase